MDGVREQDRLVEVAGGHDVPAVALPHLGRPQLPVARRPGAPPPVFVHPSLDTAVAPLPEFADPDGSDFEPVGGGTGRR
ncbi:hypothetical protein [Streptomyces sp. NPDC057280]|uniref:hypothetical protein n=1 Tax=Streptomyces sp. NPDC057280 TaxID=3346081 RepID=UPI003633A907